MNDKENILDTDKLPPLSEESEISVIGGMLKDETALHRAIEYLQPDDFYSSERKKIFIAAFDLFECGTKVDIVTIGEQLKQNGDFDRIGNYKLTEYVARVPSTANCEHHCRIVKEHSLTRQAIGAATVAVNSLFDRQRDSNEIVNELAMRLIELQSRRTTAQWTPLSHAIAKQIEAIGNFLAKVDDEQKIFGLPTGFTELDEILCGFKKAEMIVLAGRPGLGKSALMMNIAENVAAKHGSVGIFSLEMSNEALATRSISMDSKIDSYKLMSRKVSHADFIKASKNVLERINTSDKIKVIDKGGLTPAEIFIHSKRLKVENPDLRLLAIDYLQIMGTSNARMNDTEKVTYFSNSVKRLGKEMDLPVLVLSQLSRACEDRTDRRPQLSDLRQSGAIEQDADVAMFIYRDDYYTPGLNEGISEIIVAKQKNGRTGTVRLGFTKEFTKFTNLDTRYQDKHNGTGHFSNTNSRIEREPTDLPF